MGFGIDFFLSGSVSVSVPFFQVAISEQYLIPKARKDHGMDKVRQRCRLSRLGKQCNRFCDPRFGAAVAEGWGGQTGVGILFCDYVWGGSCLHFGKGDFFFFLVWEGVLDYDAQVFPPFY